MNSCIIESNNYYAMNTEPAKIAFDIIDNKLYCIAIEMELMQKIDLYLQADTQRERDSIAYYILKDHKLLKTDNTVRVDMGNTREIEISLADDRPLAMLGARWHITETHPKEYLFDTTMDRSYYLENIGEKRWGYTPNNYTDGDHLLQIELLTDEPLTTKPILNHYAIDQLSQELVHATSDDETLNVAFTIDESIIIGAPSSDYTYLVTSIYQGKVSMHITNNADHHSTTIDDHAIAAVAGENRVDITFRGITERWE